MSSSLTTGPTIRPNPRHAPARRRRNLLLGGVLAIALTGCDATEGEPEGDPPQPGEQAPGDDAPGETDDPGGTGS